MLTLVPVVTKPGVHVALLDGRVVAKSRQPFFAAARVLLAEGVPADTVLEARHKGSGIVAMRRTVGEAAGLRVEDGEHGPMRLRMWEPFGNARSGRSLAPGNATKPKERLGDIENAGTVLDASCRPDGPMPPSVESEAAE